MSSNGLGEGLDYRFPLAIIYYGVPLPGKNNPYIVLTSKERDVVRVSIMVEEADKPSARIRGLQLGWRYEIAIKSFVDEVSARLEQPLGVELDIEVREAQYPPAASIYAAATIAIVEAVSEQGGYELSLEEVLQAANDIDSTGGAGLDYLDALREAILRGKSLIYRRGEEPIELPGNRELAIELVGEEDIGNDITDKLEDPLYTEITRLLGLNVVDVANKVRRGLGIEALEANERIENAAYFMLYGVAPPDPGCKWTPSLQRVYGVCRAGTGLGDRVAFLL